MAENRELVIGLFGFGVVGEGLYKVLNQTPSLNARIKKVCIKQVGKSRNAPAELFTTDKDVLLNDPEINVIVEVIDDAVAAFEIAQIAFANGKELVSASKKMIADNLPALLKLQKEKDRSFLYEAAACASIPVVRNLEEYYDNDLLQSIQAIVNGSTNFILTKMFEEGLDFKQALLLAQQAGFAESNPTLDVEGIDAVNKWVILLLHAYGLITTKDELLYHGIQHIHAADAAVAKEKNQQIKLVAGASKLQSGEVAAYVLPQFVEEQNQLSYVRNEYNGVVIESGFADKQFFYGKGAGSFPTASAVLSDIAALRYQYKYEYKKLYFFPETKLSNSFYLRVYVSFKDTASIPKNNFEWIEEWHVTEDRTYLVGVISQQNLKKSNWWRTNDVSLILCPDAIIEDVDIRKVKKKSLELAGILN